MEREYIHIRINVYTWTQPVWDEAMLFETLTNPSLLQLIHKAELPAQRDKSPNWRRKFYDASSMRRRMPTSVRLYSENFFKISTRFPPIRAVFLTLPRRSAPLPISANPWQIRFRFNELANASR